MFANDFDYDVIVVGAGISGLTAAFNLIHRDPVLSVLILEASDTVGGRTKPIPMESGSTKVFLDSGGHFVSKRQSHLVSLLRKLDIEIVDYNFTGKTLTETSPDNFVMSDNTLLLFGTDMDKDELTLFYRKLEMFCKEISLENPMGSVESEYLDSITMEDFINRNLDVLETRQHFRNLVRMTCGSEPADISPLFFLAYCNSCGGLLASFMREYNGGKSSYIKGGVQHLIDKLVSEIGEHRIFVDHPVIKINRSEKWVAVQTAKNMFKCRCAIVSIAPPQLIKMNFDPPLNAGKLEVLRKLKGKRWMKFIATYKKAFWERKSLSGDIFINPEVPTRPAIVVLNISTDDCSALMGVVDRKRLKNVDNHDLEVLQQLSKYLGSEAFEPLDYIERHWPENYIEGPMCTNPKPGIMKSFHEIRRPIGRLFFAGSETATYWYGHIGGAVQTGLRAALEVLYEIRPQVLRYKDFAELKPRRDIMSFYDEAMGATAPQGNWLAKTAGGLVGTVGAYLATDTLTSVYRNVFGTGGNKDNGTVPPVRPF